MDAEKQKKFLTGFAYYGVIVACAFVGIKLLLPPLMPFVIGFLVAWILRAPARALGRRLHIGVRIPAILMTAIFYICAAAVIFLASAQIVSALKDWLPRLPQIFSEQLMPRMAEAFNALKAWLEPFEPTVAADMSSWFSELSSTLEQAISSLSTTALRLLSGAIAGIPSMILKIVLSIVSTFFVTIDYERIIGFGRRVIPDKHWNMLRQAKGKFVHTLTVFFKAYALIFLLSFAELTAGFFIMRIPYVLGVALLVAVVDILPVLGTGAVLLPWAVVAAVSGNIPLMAGMLILYVVMTVVRNIVEPKLVGSQIGLRPLVTLMSMIVGLHFFGVFGLLLCPIA